MALLAELRSGVGDPYPIVLAMATVALVHGQACALFRETRLQETRDGVPVIRSVVTICLLYTSDAADE